jgi:ATP-dependent RNA helicase DDX27
MAMEEDKSNGEVGTIAASIRSAKKAQRPAKIGEAQSKFLTKSDKARQKKTQKKQGARRRNAGFEREMGQKSVRTEGVRATKGDKIGGMGKKKGGKRKGK